MAAVLQNYLGHTVSQERHEIKTGPSSREDKLKVS